jgi:hypothetical protein
MSFESFSRDRADTDKMRRPNLFVIGAMKAGTSSLCQGLSDHPGIFMAPIKEPMHFSRKENWSRGHEEYLRLFQGALNERYLAEGSTEYTKRPFRLGVPERLHEFNPDARLVYVMRDPFSRLVSQYRHQIAKRRERRSLVQALKQRSDYLTNSHYAYQLKPYLELFDRPAIHLDTFESLISSPLSFYSRVFEWLGIDASFIPPSAGQHVNVSPETLELLDEESLRVRSWRYLRRHTGIRQFLPAGIRRWYSTILPKSFLHTASEEFVRQVEQARRAVQPLLAEWIEELKELTNHSYNEWPSGRGGTEAADCRSLSLELWLPKEIVPSHGKLE